MEQYAREDRFRLHEEKMEAYSNFYISAGHARRVLNNSPTAEVAEDVRSEVWHAFTRVVLVGERSVLDVANEILSYVTAVASGEHAFDVAQYRALIHRLQATARADITGVDLIPNPESETTIPESR